MKRIFYLMVVIMFTTLLSSCSTNINQILKEASQTIIIPSITTSNIELPTSLLYEGYMIDVKWESSNVDVINNDGIVNQDGDLHEINLDASLSYKKHFYFVSFNIVIEAKTYDYENRLLNEAIQKISIPNYLFEDFDLPTKIVVEDEIISISWGSSDESVISNSGKIKRHESSFKQADLTAILSLNGQQMEKGYNVTVYSTDYLLNQVASKITFPKVIDDNIELLDQFAYGIKGEWISSNPNLLSHDGIILAIDKAEEVKMTLKLILDEKEQLKVFEFTLIPKMEERFVEHHILDYVNDFETNNMENVQIDGNYLVLDANVTAGSYESKVFSTNNLVSLVGSWSAITGIDFTVELLVRVQVDNEWSSYLSYGIWGLGRENKGITTTSIDGLAKMSTDELMILNNKYASAVQYKIVLRRNNLSNPSPKLLLVSLALELKDYDYVVENIFLPSVDYLVPMLNQNAVPTIGNSICSPTSTTMLLKFKGFDFTNFDSLYEHRYIARLVRDYGHNIYGNWVYNTAVIGAMGVESYVKRMYSLNELMRHLAMVGPVAASVKGNMEGLYTTSGHLIVIRGYKEVNGKLVFICNDPNLKNIYYEYSAETIENVWRNIVYVIK